MKEKNSNLKGRIIKIRNENEGNSKALKNEVEKDKEKNKSLIKKGKILKE